MSPDPELPHSRQFAAEIKFLLSPDQADAIHAGARRPMDPDPHGAGPFGDNYRTTSLYCDTPSFDVLHKRGSYGRGKYRIRVYGDGPTVFLERKLRTGFLVGKRRTRVALPDVAALDAESPDSSFSGYWFHRRLRKRGLSPVCQIAYDRNARVLESPSGPLRLTIDQRLRACRADGFRFLPADSMAAIVTRPILELKFRQAMPELFRRLVDEFGLLQSPVSKYRLAAARLGFPAPVAGRKEEALCA